MLKRRPGCASSFAQETSHDYPSRSPEPGSLPDAGLSPANRWPTGAVLCFPALQIPLAAIDGPEQLPPFLLLGQRDDATFRREGDGFTIDYTWPAFTQGPVVRLTALGPRAIEVEEFWDGQSLGCSGGSGATLAEALTYSFRTLVLRDVRRFQGGGGGYPFHPDVREGFFQRVLEERLGLSYQMPWHGQQQVVSLPGGIVRALVLPGWGADVPTLARLARAYRRRPESYGSRGCPGPSSTVPSPTARPGGG